MRLKRPASRPRVRSLAGLWVLLAAVPAGASPTVAVHPPAEWRARPVRLPPLYWYERDQDSRVFMAGLLYWDWSEGATAQRLLLPVFYQWREEERSLFVTLPLVFGARGPEGAWTVAGPYFRSRSARFTRTAFFPLYWQQTRAGGSRVTAALPFLFYDYRSRDRSRIDQVFLLGARRVRGPVDRGLFFNYAWRREPDQAFHTFFPILWHRRSLEARTDVWGLLYRRDEFRLPEAGGHRRYRGLAPLAGWGGTTASSDVRSSFVFPFYSYARSPGSWSLLTLPGSAFRGPERWRGHAALYFFDRSPGRRVDGIFPLWMRERAKDMGEGRDQVGLFYDRREGGERFQTLFPLYGYWSDPEGSRFLTWGYWRRRSERLDDLGRSTGREVSGWALLYHWHSNSDGDRTRILFPAYWSYRRAPDWSLDLLPPIYVRYRDGDFRLTGTLPFFHSRTDERSAWSVLFLYWGSERGERRRSLLAPLCYSDRDPARSNLITPLLWVRRGPLSREGAWPLGYWYESREKARRLVFPVYWHSRSEDRRWTLWGPAYASSRPGAGSRGLFPLWGRFWSERERGSYLAPFYVASGDGGGNGRLTVPALLATGARSGRGTPQERLDLYYLLLGSYSRSAGRRDHGFFPLYRYVRDGDFRNLWAPRILPLMAWESRAGRRHGYVFPAAWSRRPESEWEFVAPLWYSSRQYDAPPAASGAPRTLAGRLQIGFPLWWHGEGGGRRFTYVPPVYARHRGPSGGLRVVTPLWWEVDRTTGAKFRTLFPLYWRVRTAPSAELRGQSATAPAGSVAGERPAHRAEGSSAPVKDVSVYALYYTVRVEGPDPSRTVGLAPFFSRTTAGADDRYFEILGGLFARDVRGGYRRFRWFYVFLTPPRALPAEGAGPGGGNPRGGELN